MTSEPVWKDPAAALREIAPCEPVPPGLRPLLLQAAAEIERLRAGLEAISTGTDPRRPGGWFDEGCAHAIMDYAKELLDGKATHKPSLSEVSEAILIGEQQVRQGNVAYDGTPGTEPPEER